VGLHRVRTRARSRDLRLRLRFRRALVLSLLLHVTIGVFLLVTIRREGRLEMLPPPAPVTMVFESGRRSGPTLPNPSEQATPATPSPPATEPPQPPAPEPLAPEPLAPEPAAPPPPVAQAPTLPAPEPPPPPEEQPAVPVPSPPPAVEALPVPPPVETLPKPPEQAPARQPPPPSKPPPVQPLVKRTAPSKPLGFPAPMDFSFGKSSSVPEARTRASAARRPPGSIDMSLGPAKKGAANNTPFADIDSDQGGPDWRNALSLWVSQHAYYPEQARRNGEEGDAKVHVVAQHNGRVTSVELIGRSGSTWLDLALQALFRDARIPPLSGSGNEPIEFDFTMHYILRRVP
jgi:periplasmic protein TonB